MPVVSQGVPAFASSVNGGHGPNLANDNDPGTSWEAASMLGWIAYDISGVPVGQRQQVLIAWYSPHALDYIRATPQATDWMPINYTLEMNSGAGGGSVPPASGWTQLAAVSSNNRSSRQHLVSLNGANWVRMSITMSSDPSVVALDLDIQSAASGATDDWLFMGDSITFMSLPRYLSDLPKLLHAANPGYYPAVIDAAIGGTSTATAISVIDDTLSNFPGRFVTLNYGTNDDPSNFHMEDLVKKVIAAGKIPVIPHMPWSDTSAVQQKGPGLNAAIDALYAKYPSIVRGPDLWTFFTNRTDLIPSGDIHPNTLGQEELRKQWALAIEKIYR
jgi:GDSL-like Lipase/Acylhydrolase family